MNMLFNIFSVPILPEDLARMESEDKPLFALPAVVVHQPNLLKTELDAVNFERITSNKLRTNENKIRNDSGKNESKNGKYNERETQLLIENVDRSSLIGPHQIIFPSLKNQLEIANQTEHDEPHKITSSRRKIKRSIISFRVRINKTNSRYNTSNNENPSSISETSLFQKEKSDEENNTQEDEDVAVGLVLAVRSLVQLLVTPAVARCSTAMGYTRPMVLGCCCLVASTTGGICLHVSLISEIR